MKHKNTIKEINLKKDLKCEIKCYYGDDGHCGRTEFEYYHHCELLRDKNEKQRNK